MIVMMIMIFWSDFEVCLNSEDEKVNGVLAVEIHLPLLPPREFFDNIKRNMVVVISGND